LIPDLTLFSMNIGVKLITVTAVTNIPKMVEADFEKHFFYHLN
jgi:hypothetical protein